MRFSLLIASLLGSLTLVAQEKASAPPRLPDSSVRTVSASGVAADGAVSAPGVTLPTKVKDLRPSYPPDAAKAGLEGTVGIEATIAVDGTVTEPRVLRSIALLDRPALDAVRQWKFTPAAAKGVPIPMKVMLEVSFVLPIAVTSQRVTSQLCSSWPSQKSPQSTQVTSVKVTNETTRNVDLFWFQLDGTAKKYTTLQPRGSISQPTYAGHVWGLRTLDEKCLSIFAATQEPGEIRVAIRSLIGGVEGGIVGGLESAPPPPPPPPPPAVPVRISAKIPSPKRIKDARAVYPDVAAAARVQGVVILEIIIGPDGAVSNPKVLRSIPLLDQAAIDAVLQWQYEPTRLNGVPVPVIMTVTVNFTLQ